MNKTKPVFFLASLFAASSLFAETAWVTGAYDTRDWDPGEDNILRMGTTALLGTSDVVRGFGTAAQDSSIPRQPAAFSPPENAVFKGKCFAGG